MEKINDSFVALDIETATQDRTSICQIGIVEVANGIVLQPKSWLVQPEGNQYNYINISIHGITPDETKNSPSFPEVWKEVLPYLQNKIVVAHNSSFDMYALRDAFNKYGMEYPTFDHFCTLRIARYIIKGCYSYSLDAITNYLGIDFGVHHKADSDALGCALLLLKCLKTDHIHINELEEKYGFHRGRFAPNVFIPQGQNSKYFLEIKQYGVKIKELENHPELVDEGNYFYGKSVCFTGKTQFSNRMELLQKVKNVGGIPTNSVTSNTDVLVVGQQDYRVVGKDGMSTKQRKALSLLEKGHEIEILSEKEFLNRI